MTERQEAYYGEEYENGYEEGYEENYGGDYGEYENAPRETPSFSKAGGSVSTSLRPNSSLRFASSMI